MPFLLWKIHIFLDLRNVNNAIILSRTLLRSILQVKTVFVGTPQFFYDVTNNFNYAMYIFMYSTAKA